MRVGLFGPGAFFVSPDNAERPTPFCHVHTQNYWWVQTEQVAKLDSAGNPTGSSHMKVKDIAAVLAMFSAQLGTPANISNGVDRPQPPLSQPYDWVV